MVSKPRLSTTDTVSHERPSLQAHVLCCVVAIAISTPFSRHNRWLISIRGIIVGSVGNLVLALGVALILIWERWALTLGFTPLFTVTAFTTAFTAFRDWRALS